MSWLMLSACVSCGSAGKVQSSGKTAVAKTPVSTRVLNDDERTRFEQFFLEAQVQQLKGNFDASFELLRHCNEINPDAPEVCYRLGQYYAVMHQDSLAEYYFDRAREYDPGNDVYQEMVAQMSLKKGNFDKAIETYEDLYSHNLDRSDILEMLLQLYMQRGDYNNAISTLNRLEVAEGRNEKVSVTKAQLYTQTGEHKKAIEEMDKLIAEHPSDLNIQTIKGDFLMEQGKNDEAYAIYQNVLKEEPDNSAAMASLYRYYKRVDDETQAEQMLRSLLKNDKTAVTDKIDIMRDVVQDNASKGGDSLKVINIFKDVVAGKQKTTDMLLLYAIYLNSVKADKDTIATVYHRILDVDRESSVARIELIQYAWEQKDYDEVIRLARPATEYDSENMGFYYYMGIAHYMKKENEAALETFRKGISVINSQSDPSLVSDYYALMGDILQAKGDRKGAFEAYDSCLQWKDDNVGCMNNYAYYLSLEKKDLDKAESMSYKTIHAEPKNATFLDTYAWILFQKKRYDEAKVYIDQALENDTLYNGEIFEHAGDIYYLSGDKVKAQEYWEQAQENYAKEEDYDEKKHLVLQRKIKQKKYISK